MGRFEEQVYCSDIAEAESALQWSSEGGLVTLHSYGRIVEAARYFRGQIGDYEALRAKLESDGNVMAAALQRITELESALEASQDHATELGDQNQAMVGTIQELVDSIRGIENSGTSLLDEVGGLTVDGWPAPWKDAENYFGNALEQGVQRANNAARDYLDEEPEEESATQEGEESDETED